MKAFKTFVVAVLALVSAACGGEHTLERHAEIHVSVADAEAYPEAVTAVVYGIDAWAEDTGGVIAPRLVIGGRGPHTLKFRDTDLFGCEAPRDHSAGCADVGPDGVTITIATQWPIGMIARVTMHEVGHGLGLDHAPAGLMCEATSTDRDAPAYIDSAAAAAAYAKFGLSIATDAMRPAWACPR